MFSATEKFRNIDRRDERTAYEGTVREKNAISGKTVNMWMEVPGSVTGVVQFMNTVMHRGG